MTENGGQWSAAGHSDRWPSYSAGAADTNIHVQASGGESFAPMWRTLGQMETKVASLEKDLASLKNPESSRHKETLCNSLMGICFAAILGMGIFVVQRMDHIRSEMREEITFRLTPFSVTPTTTPSFTETTTPSGAQSPPSDETASSAPNSQ